MSLKYPDAYPGESEQQYWVRKEEEEEEQRQKQPDSDSGLLFALVQLFFLIAKVAVVFGVFIYAAYHLSQKLLGEEIDKLKIWGFTLLFTYIILCIIFFLKGIIIGLRAKRNKLWILPWGICVLLCCIVPAYIVKHLVTLMFPLTERESMWCLIISWGAFLISLLYIYGIYQFKTSSSPRIFNWIFTLGLKVSR